MENITPEINDVAPAVEFGLCYAGDMDAYLKFDIPLDDYPAYDYGPMRSLIDTKVLDFVNLTHDKYRRMGYFTAPFMVRCALRGRDGKILFVSKPELMTAGLLPPCVSHYSFVEQTTLDMQFKLKGSPFFKLMVRLGDLPEGWAEKIKCADIYVSRQIPVFRDGWGHRGDYTDVLRSIDTRQSVYDQYDSGEFVLMLKGRYCKNESSPVFARHYSDANLSKSYVWYVRPNNDLEDMLEAETEFYNIASIDADDIIGRDTFQTILIRSTLNSILSDLDTLDESPEITAQDREEMCPLQSSCADREVICPLLLSCANREEVCPRTVVPPLHGTDSDAACPAIKSLRLLAAFTSGLSPPRSSSYPLLEIPSS